MVVGPILEYLRHGHLRIPDNISINCVLEEANFYSIDIMPGLCGFIREGLYTSSTWIIYIERDHDNPWLFGISGFD